MIPYTPPFTIHKSPNLPTGYLHLEFVDPTTNTPHTVAIIPQFQLPPETVLHNAALMAQAPTLLSLLLHAQSLLANSIPNASTGSLEYILSIQHFTTHLSDTLNSIENPIPLDTSPPTP